MSKTINVCVSVVLVALIVALGLTLVKDARYEPSTSYNNGTVTVTPYAMTLSDFPSKFLHKFKVYIVNDLPHGKSLGVHCRSKGTDKGSDVLDYDDVFEFETEYRYNLPLTAKLWTDKYWCHMTWEGGHMHNKAFWVDQALIENCELEHCLWYARNDGLYLKTISSDDQKFYEWSEW